LANTVALYDYCPVSSVTSLPVSQSLHTCLLFAGRVQTILESCVQRQHL
jgi:hypothetical protein